jgi:hypothetical protein
LQIKGGYLQIKGGYLQIAGGRFEYAPELTSLSTVAGTPISFEDSANVPALICKSTPVDLAPFAGEHANGVIENSGERG